MIKHLSITAASYDRHESHKCGIYFSKTADYVLRQQDATPYIVSKERFKEIRQKCLIVQRNEVPRLVNQEEDELRQLGQSIRHAHENTGNNRNPIVLTAHLLSQLNDIIVKTLRF